MRRYQKIGILLALAILLFSGCSAQSESGADSQEKISEETMRTQQNQEGNTAQLREESEVRDGTSEDTLATPEDFPEAYDYGSGLLSGSFYRTGPTDSAVTADGSEITESGWNRFFLWTSDGIRAIDTHLVLSTFFILLNRDFTIEYFSYASYNY
ncbi:hypothetical protein [Zhenpiania hominis]|uniref:hypothetical protein n=1 Tax=Zhenpiania hominis TaxID=2763644 RepID=UPI0039F5338C